MSKIVIITDTHLDARQSSSIFLKYMQNYYNDVLFPYMKENNIVDLIHLGDFTDNRNNISLQANQYIVQGFGAKLKEQNIKMELCLGNHDLAYRNNSSVHSLTGLEYAYRDNVVIHQDFSKVIIGNQKFMMCGWVNDGNYDEFIRMMDSYNDKSNTILCGHFEIAGAKHYKNSPPAEHGMNADLFKDWQDVWSGHYHTKSTLGNINYFGSLFYITWQDYGDNRGFHVFDTETKELKYIVNEYSLFKELVYNVDEIGDCKDKFVRIVKNTKPESEADFLKYIANIEKLSPIKVDVVDNTIVYEKVDHSDMDTETQQKNVKELDEYFSEYMSINYPDLEHSQYIAEHLKVLYKTVIESSFKGEN